MTWELIAVTIILVLMILTGFGLPIPEESVLLLAAWFSGSGVSIGMLVLSAALGIAIADTAGYIRGRLASKRFAQFKQGKKFMQQTGFIAVLTARFFVTSRPIVPYMAGAMRLNRFRFHSASILGAIVLSAGWIILTGFVFRAIAFLTSLASVVWTILIMVVTGVLVMYATRSQMHLAQQKN